MSLPKAQNAFLILSYFFPCYCCKKVCFKKYNKAIEKVEADVLQNLNIVTVLRRLRMHGFAIESLIGIKKRSILAYVARNKSTSVIMDA